MSAVAPSRIGRSTRGRRIGTGLLALTAALALTACSTGTGGADATTAADAPTTEAGASPVDPTTEPAPAPEELTGTLVVFAAASLQGVFEELGSDLEEANPGLEVTFNFAASSALAEQVNSGAPADVLATASAKTMEQASENLGEATTFASNTLVIVTPADNPGAVTGIDDFANADLRLAVCAVEVPCGAASEKVFTALGLTPAIDTYAENVTATLNLAVSGEVDASLVYATDALSAGDTVTTIDFPEASEAVNDNLIAPVTEAPNPAAAQAFIDLVLSPEGTAVLEAAGFTIE